MKKVLFMALFLHCRALLSMESVVNDTQLWKYRPLFEELAAAESIDCPQSHWIKGITDKAKGFYSERVLHAASHTVYTLHKGSRNISITSDKMDYPVEFSIEDFKREINKVY